MSGLHDASVIVAVAATVFALAWAAVSDVTRYEIPNRICLLIGGAYLVAAAGTPLGPWLGGLATGFAVFAFGLLLFSRGWLGGGDVKLAAAIALWAGPARLSEFALVTALAGLPLAAVLISPLGRRLPRPPQAVATDFRQPMPFGAPLAVGGAWVALLHLAQFRPGV